MSSLFSSFFVNIKPFIQVIL